MRRDPDMPRVQDADVYCSNDPWQRPDAYGKLLWHLTRWKLASRYRGTVLGYVWSWLTPVAMMAIYYVVFRYVFKVGASAGHPFIVLFLPAFFIWNAMATAISEAAYSFYESGNLMRNVFFPRSTAVVAGVAANFVHLAISIPLLIVALLALGVAPDFNLLLLLPVLLLAFAFVLGVALFVSAAAVLYPDVLHLVQIAVNAAFFLSPVAYSIDSIPLPSAWRWAYLVCWPPAAIVELGRAAFLGGPTEWALFIPCAPASLLVMCFGWLYFRSRRRAVDPLL